MKVGFLFATFGIVMAYRNNIFELSNHLGNVLTVVSDRKLGVDNVNNTTGVAPPDGLVDFYLADVVSAKDYYAFGWEMPGRSFNPTAYRHGFGGYEKDDEVSGNGNSYDFGGFGYDPRLNRRKSKDPMGDVAYPGISPYASMNNNPIANGDVQGQLVVYYGGLWPGHDGDCYLELQTYWDAQLQANVARTLNDYQAVFFNGSDNLLTSTAAARGQQGNQTAFQFAYYLRDLLDAQRIATGKSNEVLNFVSHSMGGAPSAAMIERLSKLVYPSDYENESLRGKNIFQPGDFGNAYFLDPYQGADITAPSATNNFQRSHYNSLTAVKTAVPMKGIQNYKATLSLTIGSILNPIYGAHDVGTFANSDIFTPGDVAPKNVGGKQGSTGHNAGHNDSTREYRGGEAKQDNTATPRFIPR